MQPHRNDHKRNPEPHRNWRVALAASALAAIGTAIAAPASAHVLYLQVPTTQAVVAEQPGIQTHTGGRRCYPIRIGDRTYYVCRRAPQPPQDPPRQPPQDPPKQPPQDPPKQPPQDPPKQPPQQPGPIAGLTADEQQMFDLVNAERQKAGLRPLQIDLEIVKVARLKSQDMIDNNYFGHNSPTYGSPFDMMRRFGISFRYAGENIAGNPSVTGAHQALMNSSGHRANILKPEYTHIGIGIVKGGPYGYMFSQMFVGRP